MQCSLISVPYHQGREGVGMGAGPGRLEKADAASTLEATGHSVTRETVERETSFTHEIGAVMDVNSQLANHVTDAVDAGRLPIVLAGNCNSCLGTLSGLPSAPGIVWFDAHGDSNTPETTQSGFFDGMTLPMTTGQCWTNLVSEHLPAFTPVPEEHILLAGVRSLDPGETEVIERSAMTLTEWDENSPAIPASKLYALEDRTQTLYLHIDLDVLDPSTAPANEYAPPGGISPDQLEDAIRSVMERFEVKAAALTAYDPAFDEDDCVLQRGLDLLSVIGEQIDDDKR